MNDMILISITHAFKLSQRTESDTQGNIVFTHSFEIWITKQASHPPTEGRVRKDSTIPLLQFPGTISTVTY